MECRLHCTYEIVGGIVNWIDCGYDNTSFPLNLLHIICIEWVNGLQFWSPNLWWIPKSFPNFSNSPIFASWFHVFLVTLFLAVEQGLPGNWSFSLICYVFIFQIFLNWPDLCFDYEVTCPFKPPLRCPVQMGNQGGLTKIDFCSLLS